jgi:hypothetical protein
MISDYDFPSVARAAEVTGFFFGADFARRVESERWTRIPECTGIWWQTPAKSEQSSGPRASSKRSPANTAGVAWPHAISARHEISAQRHGMDQAQHHGVFRSRACSTFEFACIRILVFASDEGERED